METGSVSETDHHHLVLPRLSERACHLPAPRCASRRKQRSYDHRPPSNQVPASRISGYKTAFLPRRACDESQCRYSRSEEHTSELQSLMRISYAVFCMKKK